MQGSSRRGKGAGRYGRKPDFIGSGNHRRPGRCGASSHAAQKLSRANIRPDSDKAAMRAQLSEQLNTILETRDSARGLIVSMSDVLFDTGQYSLKPGAREKLAKVAGILIAYPWAQHRGRRLHRQRRRRRHESEAVGESRRRRARLPGGQGVTTNSVSAKGFGNTLPVASNDNSAGRQENRRVELVVSGDAIGSPANA
jgi:outer membrane protein OmpA-like peptidoglycan-associated protein